MGRFWGFFQEKLIRNLSRFLLLGVVLLAFLEVVRRYVFGVTFLWFEDVEIYFNLAAVFLAFGLAEKQKVHIKLDIVVHLLKKRKGFLEKIGEGMDILATLISLAFCILFVWFGMGFVKKGMEFGRRTDNADLLLWPFYVVLLVGFTFLAVEYARNLYAQLRGSKEGPQS